MAAGTFFLELKMLSHAYARISSYRAECDSEPTLRLIQEAKKVLPLNRHDHL